MQVLRHEYAHHFMFNNYAASAMPLWLTEGWAEFNATATRNADGSVTFGQIPVYRGNNFIYAHGCVVSQIITTSKLEDLTHCQPSDLYAHGWLLTDYLTFTPGGWDQLGQYLDAINRGEPMAKTASAFGDLHALSRSLDRHLNARTLPSYTVPISAIRIAPPVVVKLSDGEAATMPARIRSQAGVNDRTAPDVYKRAAAAAPYPDDAAAQLELAEAAYDAKHYDVADAAARRAFKADPQSVRAADYVGRAILAPVAVAQKPDQAVAKEARGWFVRANKLDPHDAEPLALYYRSFLVAGEAPSRNAKMGLLKAVELAPQAQELRLYAAYACLVDGEAAPARTYLTALAYNPHARKGIDKLARDTLALVDKGDLSGAAAMLQALVRNPEAKRDDREG